MYLVIRLVAVWLLLLTTLSARAEVELPAGVVSFDLGGRLERVEDPSGKLTLDEISQHKGFAPGAGHIGASSSAWWLRVVLHNQSGQKEWWLDTGNRTLQELEVYVVLQDGSVHRQAASSNLPFSERPLPTGVFTLPLDLPAGQTVSLYIRARSTGWLGVALRPVLWDPQTYQSAERRREIEWLVYLGMGLALALFNLLLFAAIRDPNHLWYVASVISMVWASSSGYGTYGLAFKILWPDHPLFEQVAWIASILAAGLFAPLFVAQFVKLREQTPRYYRLDDVLMVAYLVAGLARIVVTLQPHWLSVQVQQQITSWGMRSFACLTLLCMVRTLYLVWGGNRTAKIVSLAWAPVFLAGLVTFVLGPASPAGLLMWSSALEFILMSLALADRFNQERRGREAAQAALVEGLQRSEKQLEQKVLERTEELAQEKQRAQHLLHNILPIGVAEELLRDGAVQPRRHESVSILFTDFSGFTQAASSMPAQKMVSELNDIFCAFDRLADECGVEKIKTIGDAYMAVAGLDGATDHAERCVRLGLQMAAHLEDRNSRSAFKWAVRVGVHSGPVISGVVGQRKYAYDIWGDSVNIAARMESAGHGGRVNISATTYDLASNAFGCSYRGKIEARGKGAIDMYFVDGPVLPDDHRPLANHDNGTAHAH